MGRAAPAVRDPARPGRGPQERARPGATEGQTITALRRLPQFSLLVGTLLVGGTSPASAAPDPQCRRIDAIGVVQAGPDGHSTTAVITRDGLLKGTSAATFDVDVTAVPPVLPFTGSIVFTTHRGTLTSTLTGTLDVATGAFLATGPVSSGTGRFTGATGSLSAAGTQDLVTGTFTEVVTGTVCLDEHH